MDFRDKVALVTGGAVGIGKAITSEFARSGAKVLINYHHSETAAKTLCEELALEGLESSMFRADVSKLQEANELVKAVIERYGKLDILINNSGITRDQLMLRMSEEDFDKVIDVNLKGTWNLIKSAVPFMAKARTGKIINITSVTGIVGNAGQSNYAASKAGIIGLTKSVAREFAKRNITCNAVAPGFIETNMTETLPDKIKEYYLSQIPLGRFGKTRDVASMVLFLASEQADYITGQVMKVDGGMVMN
ncbi:MAG: 3-oxoacyl-[acyl-carrier-protein] reductase [Candidatus Marinimicrobia bacterium]|nr:3-oxoacyl-[acyl-carrier-protein] reductase [Candidatus Neomarinimicrobiota bacterium]